MNFPEMFAWAEQHPEYWKELYALGKDRANQLESDLAAAREELAQAKKLLGLAVVDLEAFNKQQQYPFPGTADTCKKIRFSIAQPAAVKLCTT